MPQEKQISCHIVQVQWAEARVVSSSASLCQWCNRKSSLVSGNDIMGFVQEPVEQTEDQLF